MRFNSYVNGTYGFAGINVAGGTLTLPLKIQNAPTSALEAVNRAYVTTAVTAIIGSSITGTFNAARLPSYTGADVSSAGAGVFTLSNTGVTAATYAKVTVDNKGRVTTGGVLVSGDVPNLSYTKLIDRPTTLAGYGITDVVSLNGATMTGPLLLNGTPTSSTDLVNKAYVDTRVGGSGGSAFVTGDIISKSSSTTPSGFLRCNGGSVSKTTYAPLFSLLGYTYAKGSAINSAGKPWRMQYDFNKTQTVDITGWSTGTSLPNSVLYSQPIVTSNRVYLLGNVIGSNSSSTVYTAPINTDGTLGIWSTSSPLPVSVYSLQAVVTSNRVYLLGGLVNGNTPSSTVYTAVINVDGTLGAWVTSSPLPATSYQSQAIVTSSRVYLLGGINNGAASASVLTASINTDGTLGTWGASTSLPATSCQSQAIVTSNRVYLLGGLVNGSASSTVYTASINADGTLSAWTTSTSLPATVTYSQAIVTSSRVFVMGGNVNGSESSAVYSALINIDGTLGAWTTSTSLPATVTYSQAIVTSSRVFLLGGYVNLASSSTVYSAPFLGGFNDYTNYTTKNYSKFYTDYTKNSGGKPWVLQYGFNTLQTSASITGWSETTTIGSTLFHSTQSIVTKNRVYILGGNISSAASALIYSFPINEDGTLGTMTQLGSLPAAVTKAQAVVIGSFVYVIGGQGRSTVFSATINTDGTLGVWSTVNPLPINISEAQAIVTSSRVYLLGNTVAGSVYSAPINSDNTLGTWTASAALFDNVTGSHAVVTNTRVYLIAGYSTTSANIVNSIQSAPINADGTLGTWVASGVMNSGLLTEGITLTSNSRVYIIGGIANYTGTYRNHVFSAPINADGTLGSWASDAALPVSIFNSQAVVTNSKIYLINGYISGSPSNRVFMAPFLGGSNDYTTYPNVLAPNTFRSTAGKPWCMQYDFNDQQTTDITSWSAGTALPLSIHRSQAIITNSRVYLLGGFVNNVESSAVYTAPINADGTLGAWTTTTALPLAVCDSQAVVTNGRVYLIGGRIGGAESANTYTAVINADGTLGTWSAGTTLPGTARLSQAILTNNRIHLLGGFIAGTASEVTYTASVNADGLVGTWGVGTSLPATIQASSAIVTKSRVYLMGGTINGAFSALIYTAPINTDGTLGTWVTTTFLPGTSRDSQAVVTNGRVYLLGGTVNGAEASTVYTAPIDTDGIVGTWTTGTSLPATNRMSQAVVTNSKIYMLGGSVAGGFSSAVYVANFLGGSRDYTNYFIGADIANPLTFTLPDFSLKEAPSFFSYIKT